MLTWLGVRIIVLMGNHDYLRKGHAFFSFLNHLPNIKFVDTTWDDSLDGDNGPACLFLPHTKTPTADWEPFNYGMFAYVFMHQTVGGSVSSNGMELEDEGVPAFPKDVKVFSGDVHVPQVVRGVEYIGSPYHVHFGDNFKPRGVLIDRRGRHVDLHMESPRRLKVVARSLRDLKTKEILKGDHVKLEMQLDATDKHDWSAIKRKATEWLAGVGAAIHGVRLTVLPTDGAAAVLCPSATSLRDTDEEVVEQFVRYEDLGPEAYETGVKALR